LRLTCAGLALLLPMLVRAQGGPPMVTDDPGTPGDGHWEINLGDSGSRTRTGWSIEAFDADINYGWGERLQLKVDAPWDAAQRDGRWIDGPGTTLFGVKWRFLDDEASGWTMSTYPQLGVNLDPGSATRGLTEPGKSLLLPIESAIHLGPVDVDGELGRSLAQRGPDTWIAGIIVAHTFDAGVELMGEAHLRGPDAGTHLLLNLGSRWQLAKGCTLLGAVGREGGADDGGRVQIVYYLGLQLQR